MKVIDKKKETQVLCKEKCSNNSTNCPRRCPGFLPFLLQLCMLTLLTHPRYTEYSVPGFILMFCS